MAPALSRREQCYIRQVGNRAPDWLRQALADLKHARNARTGGSYEWSCFAAQQAAEKALKAVFLAKGMEAWGHAVTALLAALQERIDVPPALVESAKSLDKHYIPTRYPNGFDSGAPMDFYTNDDAKAAIDHAKKIIDFCSSLLG